MYKKDIVPDPMIAIFGVISVPSFSSHSLTGYFFIYGSYKEIDSSKVET